MEKNPRRNFESLDRVGGGGGAQTSVHYQNHTLYQIHHHHYHHMLMTDECHKDPLDISSHLKYRDLNGGSTKEEQLFNYASDHNANNSTVAIKSNHHSMLMGTSSPPVAANSTPHMDEAGDYKHSRDLWFHEGN